MLPIMQFAVLGGPDTGRITQYINDTLKPKLTRIAGVAGVEMYGAAESRINVKLRMDDDGGGTEELHNTNTHLSAQSSTLELL